LGPFTDLLGPDLALLYSDRGFAYGRKGNFERAMADLDKAVALNPRNARGFGDRAAIRALRGQADAAIADADEAIRLDPKYAFAYNARGKAYFDRSQYALAAVDFGKALQLDPSLAEARQNRERAEAVLALAHGPASSPVPVERRVALVIGNSKYRSVPALPNPQRDAKVVADALKQAGFDAVDLALDLDRDGMTKALQAFRAKADSADWALVYFAGHGIEMNGVNYLIPVDAKVADSRDVDDETISYEKLLKAAGGAHALRIIILDACRDNPFKKHMPQTAALRGSLGRGLAPAPEPVQGTLVAYSAGAGEVAADDVGGVNSPFAKAFVARIKKPGREVQRVFDDVSDDVLAATNGRQRPYKSASLSGKRDFFFVAQK
jgi:uncharacterized caspase-like protein